MATRTSGARLQRRRRLGDLAARLAGAVRARRGPPARGRACRGGDGRRPPHDRGLSARPRRSSAGRPTTSLGGRAARPGRRALGVEPVERRAATRSRSSPDAVAAAAPRRRPRRRARHPVVPPPRGRRRAPARAARAAARPSAGVRSEVITRAIEGCAARRSRYPARSCGGRRVAGESPLALAGLRRRGARAPAAASFPDRPRPRPRRAVPGDDRTRRPPARPALPRHRARHRPARRPRAARAQAVRPPAVAAAVPLGVVRRAEHRGRPGAARRAACPRSASSRCPTGSTSTVYRPAERRGAPRGCASGSGCPRTGSSAPSSAACTRSRTWTRCSSAAAAVPELTLVVVGDGPERGRLEARGRATRHRGAGELPRRAPTAVADFLRASDAFLLSSHGEGMSNALLEGMACGLPCLASRSVGGAAELLGDGARHAAARRRRRRPGPPPSSAWSTSPACGARPGRRPPRFVAQRRCRWRRRPTGSRRPTRDRRRCARREQPARSSSTWSSRFPAVTETFVVNEWLALSERFRMQLVALRRSGEAPRSPRDRARAAAGALPRRRAPATVAAHLSWLVRRPRVYLSTLAAVLRGALRFSSRRRATGGAGVPEGGRGRCAAAQRATGSTTCTRTSRATRPPPPGWCTG